jgi:hypothetical protein
LVPPTELLWFQSRVFTSVNSNLELGAHRIDERSVWELSPPTRMPFGDVVPGRSVRFLYGPSEYWL